MPLERLRHHFDVNVIGQVAVTQAFLPLIRTGGGRVVTIGSAGGWITMPFGGALCATKHALRSLNDALRQELAPWGIPVILVEPGVIRTAALDKVLAGVEPVVAEFDPARRGGYEPGFRAMTEAVAQQEQRRGADPDVVAGIVVHALTARRPRTRYPAGPAARTLINVARLLPNPALDVVRRRLLLRDASTSGSSIGARHG
jgi:NAD(P)-dependent dehydrogenase (short-subunit alcohol dehydrogenase family)